MARPVGVMIIAICCFLAALYGALNGIRLIARGGFMAIFSDAGAASGLADLGAAVIEILIVFTALYILAGWGLWKLRRMGALAHHLSGSRRLCFQVDSMVFDPPSQTV